jgi:cytochrome c oxidase subunit 4
MAQDKHDDHDEHLYHVAPLKNYFMVFGTLLLMTLLTISASGHFGHNDVIVAMGIATFKAALVMLFFMHLKYDNMLNRVIFGSGFLFLLLLLAFSAFDIYTRIDATPK